MTAPLAKTHGVPDGYKARFFRVGPHRETGAPCLEVEFRDGRTITMQLDPAHARAVGARLIECVDGRINARHQSRRVLELELAEEA